MHYGTGGGVKVLLSGEGADEIFGGYGRYPNFIMREKHKILFYFLDRIRRLIFKRNIKKLKYKSEKDKKDKKIERFILNSAFLDQNELEKLCPSAAKKDYMAVRKEIFKSLPGGGNFFEQCLNYDAKTYLISVLIRQDKMSMAASIETRVPFLNYKVVNFVRGQNIKNYLTSGFSRNSMRFGKIPLKKLAAENFGSEFAYRPKSGFPLPLKKIFNNFEFAKHVEAVILPALKKINLLNQDEINRLWNERSKLSGQDVEALWNVISFGQWAGLFLEDKSKITDFVDVDINNF